MLAALHRHIRTNGGRIESPHSIFVPFSNGTEMGYAGLEAQCRELKYVTTDEDFATEFGITPEELMRS